MAGKTLTAPFADRRGLEPLTFYRDKVALLSIELPVLVVTSSDHPLDEVHPFRTSSPDRSTRGASYQLFTPLRRAPRSW